MEVVLQWARRMTWKGHHPTVGSIAGVYPSGVRLTAKKLSENGWNTLCVKEVVARHLITAHRNRSPSHDPPQARTQAAGHDPGDPR
jgi:hypothetical protein